MIHHLFLDLEDTIIAPVVRGWSKTELVNVPKIKELVRVLDPSVVSIFSFAIHTAHELKGFDTWTRPMVEHVIDRQLSLVPTVQDIIVACCAAAPGRLHPDYVTFQDISDFWSKHEAFRLFMKHHFGTNPHQRDHVHVTLIDDFVMNETWEWPDLNLSGRIINIDQYTIQCST
jgi:hypothetical protein